MKKEMYEAPEMEIVEFEMADVITTSNGCTDENFKYTPDWNEWPGNCRDLTQYLDDRNHCSTFTTFNYS